MYKTSKMDPTFSIKKPQKAFAIGMCKMKPKNEGKNKKNQKKTQKMGFLDVPFSPSTPLLTGVYAIPDEGGGRRLALGDFSVVIIDLFIFQTS